MFRTDLNLKKIKFVSDKMRRLFKNTYKNASKEDKKAMKHFLDDTRIIIQRKEDKAEIFPGKIDRELTREYKQVIRDWHNKVKSGIYVARAVNYAPQKISRVNNSKVRAPRPTHN
ncbi:MAG: hypothetical protein OIF36_01140 [Alphaproteobacteria bacterium]|nr:hypothetical protein [Alphaproteobacteria bacterium]